MSQTIDGVYRDFKTAGVPTSGEHEPPKPEIRALLKQIQNSSGMSVTRNTKAALEGVTPPNENYMGVVLTGEGAGYYSRVGGAWVFGRGFSDTLARLAVVGGTPNAIIAEAATGVAPGDVGAFIIDITEANTGPVTISINGGAFIPVLSVDGDDYEPGEFIGRMMLENLGAELVALTADPGIIAALVEEATSVAPGTWQLLRDETVAARDVALPAATAAAGSAGVATTQANRSQSEADRAALAAASIFGSDGPLYPDIPTGRADVLDGEFFKVAGIGLLSATLYRRDSSTTQTLMNEAPSALLTKSILPSHFSPNGPIIVDNANLYGGGVNAVYVPILWFVSRDGTNSTFTLTPESTEKPGFVKATLGGSTTTAYTVFLDLVKALAGTAGAVSGTSGALSGAAVALGGMFEPIAEIYNRGIKSRYFVVQTSDLTQARIFFLRKPTLVRQADGQRVLLLSGGHFFRPDLGFVSFMPPNGATYFEIGPFGSTATARRVYFSYPALVAGTTPFGLTTATTAPLGGWENHIVGTFYGSGTEADFEIIGDVPGGAVRNLFGFGKAGIAPRKNGTTTDTTVSDVNLTGLGFLAAAGGNNGSPFYGDYVPDGVFAATGYARVYVQTDIDDDFATPRAFLYFKDGTNQQFNLTLEKKFSARAAMYSATFLPTGNKEVLYYLVGVSGSAGRDIRVTGGQIYVGPMAAEWINRFDYPSGGAQATIDPVLPADLWLTAGRPLPMFPQNAISVRPDGDEFVSELTSIKDTAGGLPTIYTRSGEMLDPTNLGTTGRITYRRKVPALPLQPTLTTKFHKDMAIHIAASSSTASPKILLIGDSVMNRKIAAFLKTKLEARGMRPTFIGTMNGQGAVDAAPGDAGGPLGECREGRQFSDHTYQTTAQMVPVAAGSEAAYVAGNKSYKGARNPFIRATVGGDNPAHVFNGYIFDFAFYLSRFGLATPDFVIIGLGTNDISLAATEADALVQTLNGMTVMRAQIRAAAPACKIGFLQHLIGRSNADTRWTSHHKLIAQHIGFLNGLGDATAKLLPAYLHQHLDAGWATASSATDATSGLVTAAVSDIIHPDDLNRQIAAEVMASWVGAS